MQTKASSRRKSPWVTVLVLGNSLALLSLALPSLTFASGFQIFSQSASAAGQGAAFSAQADDPSAVYYNPAGMTQLQGVQFMASMLFVGGSTNFTQAGSGLTSRGDLGSSTANPPPTNFFLTANLKGLGERLNLRPLERVTLGVGGFAPFGLIYRWPEDGPLNSALTRAKLEMYDIRPTIAYRVTDTLSIGIGADIYTFFSWWGEGQGETRFNASPALGGFGIPATAPIEINGKNTTVGLNLSLLYTPCLKDGKVRCSFGFQYRSRATSHLDGEFRVAGGLVSDARTTLVIPQSFVFGLAYWPVRDDRHEWKVEADLHKTDWSSFKNTDVHLSNGATIPVARNWEDTLTVMLGTEYKWLDPAMLPHWNVAVRGGYWYSENAIPSQTFDPAVPDSNHHSVTAGLGFLCKAGGRFMGLISCGEVGTKRPWYQPSAIGMDFSYQALIYETRHIAGNIPAVTLPGTVDGTYKTTLHAGMFNIRLNF